MDTFSLFGVLVIGAILTIILVKMFAMQFGSDTDEDEYTAPDYPHQKHASATSSDLEIDYRGDTYTDAMTGLVHSRSEPDFGYITGTYSRQRIDPGWSSASGSQMKRNPYGYWDLQQPTSFMKPPAIEVPRCSWCGSYKTEVRCKHCGGE